MITVYMQTLKRLKALSYVHQTGSQRGKTVETRLTLPLHIPLQTEGRKQPSFDKPPPLSRWAEHLY